MMEKSCGLQFETPTFKQRIKGMLGVDFYRLFHTPLFYIFLAIAAIIPAMISCFTMMPDQNGNTMDPLYTNVWQIIAANEPLYVVKSIADYANMNMVFIFGGIMVSIFIGHDYKSGYVKQLFTTHAKKEDYISFFRKKSVINYSAEATSRRGLGVSCLHQCHTKCIRRSSPHTLPPRLLLLHDAPVQLALGFHTPPKKRPINIAPSPLRTPPKTGGE